MAEGMQASSGYFPPMVVQMVAVGEQTGKLDEVFQRLAEHYEHLSSMQRTFWIGIAWPMFELIFAVLVIGGVIFITGMIAAARGGEAMDVLGWGLVGTSGAITWFLFCGFVVGGIALGAHALIRGYTPAQTSVVYHFQYDGTRWRALAILRGAESFGRSIAMEGCTALISSSIESTQSLVQ